jgi:hypothetical protein
MLIIRLIAYSIITYLLLSFVRRVLDRSLSASRHRPVSGRPPARPVKSSVMVRCESCGTFVTRELTLSLGGKTFCSSACLEQKARSK